MINPTHTAKPKRPNPTALIIAIVLALGITAGIAAQALDHTALAVLAGAICGVGASIPATLILLAIARRREHNNTLHIPTQPQPQPTQPTIFVMGAQPFQWPTNSLQPPHLTTPIERTFTTIGDEPEAE